MTSVGCLLLAPGVWWVLRSTGAGLRLTAVGENPEAADTAGISVARTRWTALVVGGALMGLGGAFLSLSVLGPLPLDHLNGRGWIRTALGISRPWTVGAVVLGGLLFRP